MSVVNMLTVDDCELLLKSIKATDQKLISYELKPYSDSPAGFLGVHHRLILNCESTSSNDNNNVNEQKFSFFVKTMPSVKIHSDYINDIGAFKKEILLFQGLIPEMQAEVFDFPWSPKCYIARDDLLIFEDLCVRNYYTSIGKGIFDIEHCTAAIKTLADFHASSLLWENKNNAKINERYESSVKECVYVHEKNHPRNLWLISASSALILLCKKINRRVDDECFRTAVKNAVTDMGPSPYSCNVLCHGDLWANNFMFVRDTNDDTLHGMLVDYQIARYAPCALDLMCCIYLITNQSLRNQNMPRFIHMYHDELTRVLRKHNLNIETFMTLDKLMEDCSKYKITAIVEACIFGITIWLPGELAEEALGSPTKCHNLILGDRSKLMEDAFHDMFFKTQLTDLLNELLDNVNINVK